MKTKPSLFGRAIRCVQEAFEPQMYQARETPVICSICGHDRFKEQAVVILSLRALICAKCGHAEIFEGAPKVIRDKTAGRKEV